MNGLMSFSAIARSVMISAKLGRPHYHAIILFQCYSS